MFKWAIMIRFRLFLCIWLNASIFSASSEEVSFARFMADWSDFSVFPKLVKDLKFIWESKLKALWKLLVTHQVVANFLIHLIKLIATLPKPLGFKCNPSSFSSFEVIFPLSIILYYKVVVIVNKRSPPTPPAPPFTSKNATYSRISYNIQTESTPWSFPRTTFELSLNFLLTQQLRKTFLCQITWLT